MGASQIEFFLDPPLDDAMVSRLADIWLDVTDAGGAVGGVAPSSHEALKPVVEDALDRVRAGKDRMVVAYSEGDAVGVGFLSFRPGPLFAHWATVKRLQIHPSLQGRGYGGQLLDEVIRVAREIGLEFLHLTVRGGTGTEAFYERHGFEKVAEIPQVIRLAPDDTRDEIYMVATL